MADKRDLEQLIEEHGGKLIRSKKHRIYRFPSGLLFTTPSTPRCPHAYDNAITDLRNLLGLNDPNRGQPGERRERKLKRPVANQRWLGHNNVLPHRPTWQDQLASVRKEIHGTPGL